MKALITVGCKTDHGGIIVLGDSSFLVDGKAVHLDGMTHYCPKCKVQSHAISSNQGFMIVSGKSIIADGDTSTCGSRYMKISSMAVITGGPSKRNLTPSFMTSLQNNLVEEKENLVDHGLKFKVIDEQYNFPVKGCFYLLTKKDGTEYSGFTDDEGFTEMVNTGDKAENIDFHIFDFSKPMDEWK